jgi:hypothetical protein
MSFEEILLAAKRDERFMATIYAMNTLLLAKGIYTHEEFQRLVLEWLSKEGRKKAREDSTTSPVPLRA